jgi:hypothetical protein
MGRPPPDEVANDAVIAIDHPCFGSSGETNPSNKFIGVGS